MDFPSENLVMNIASVDVEVELFKGLFVPQENWMDYIVF